MLNFKIYLEEKAPKNPKPGDIWKTDGGFRGVNQSGNRQTFKDKEKTQQYVATKDTPEKEPKESEKNKDLKMHEEGINHWIKKESRESHKKEKS